MYIVIHTCCHYFSSFPDTDSLYSLYLLQHNDSDIAVEKEILLESENIHESIIDLICVYFTFDIAYPKQLNPMCLFLQHHVLDLVDKQHVPNNVTILLSPLDKY